MAPSRYLGLPWREWGRTDVELNMALHTLDAMGCPCGCAQDADIAHDEATAGRWQVRFVVCQAGAALAEFHERAGRGGDLEPGAMPYLELLPEGEQASDPLSFDPARAAAEYERHQRSLGIQQAPAAEPPA